MAKRRKRPKDKRGKTLDCPSCGEKYNINVHLWDCEIHCCNECGTEFGKAWSNVKKKKVRKRVLDKEIQLQKWERALGEKR